MCGICGYISSSNTYNGAAMVESLHHRGPDGRGSESHNFGKRTVFLGHTRLSIIDLSDLGSQPMHSPDGQISITYNGEVYNFQELKTRFLSDVTFRSGTDTEVVLHLYQRLGIDFLEHLNGDFAFAILDKSKDRLFLARDRAGVKPLYYTLSNEDLVFGSEIKALLAAGVPAKHQPKLWPQYFTFKYVPGQNTLYQGIQRLAPGTFLEYRLDNGATQLNHYWQPQVKEEYTRLSYQDAEEAVRTTLADAIKIRLIADVPVGTFLSGGLDSSIIAAHLQKAPDIKHYCAVKDEADLRKEGTTSDYQYAKLLADKWQLDLSPIPIGSTEANEDLIRTTLHYSDDLIADGSQIPSYLITKIAGQHSKVILTGMGADELFLGYGGHLISQLSTYLDRLPKSVANATARHFSGLHAGKGSFMAYKRYLVKMGQYFPLGPQRYSRYNIVGDFDSALGLFREPSSQVDDFIAPYFPGQNNFEEIFRFEWDNFLVKNLHYTDRMSMANAVESRVPFLDHRIVELAFSLPHHYKLGKNLTSKRILKTAYKKELPAPIINRRKAGFGMPLRSILSDRATLEHLLPINYFKQFDSFSTPAIQKVIDQHLNGTADQSALIYALVSWRLWMEGQGQ